jgi:ABC-type Fe3+-siderophore transport system permease subunit
MTSGSLVFFALFALVQVGMYVAIRRGWLRLFIAGPGGALFSIVLMTLFSVAQGAGTPLAVLTGVVIGGLFSAASIAIAAFFQRNPPGARASEPPQP